MNIVGLIVLGAGCGLIVGMTSTGGGALLTPGLMMLGIPPAMAVGTDLLIASVMKLFGGGVYALRREVHWPTVFRLACGSIPGALLGVALLNQLSAANLDVFLQKMMGVALLLAGGTSLARVLWKPAAASRPMPGRLVTVVLGALVGMLVSITTIGSGSVLLCVLALLFPLAPATLVGTDLVHALLLSATATLAQLASGRVDFLLAAWVLLGGIPGVLLGARLASRIPERAMRGGLACVLVILGLNFTLTVKSHPAPPTVAEQTP
jgi:uncharacterized membrane protein YfcA